MPEQDGRADETASLILEGVRRGDQNAWRTFVEQHERSVASTVVGMLGRGPEAEDVGQEVFLRFFGRAKDFRGDADVSTYLTRTAINLSLNALKRRSRMRRWFLGDSVETVAETLTSGSTNEGPDKDAERGELGQAVERAIRRLAPDQRAVVVLRLVREFSTRETARLLDIPEGTVMSRLKRAQSRLRTQLTAEGFHA